MRSSSSGRRSSSARWVERRVADALEVAHHLGDHLGLRARGLLAQPLRALLLRPLALGHVLELRDQLARRRSGPSSR